MQKNRAAIYARFSSHNQRSESIEIQVDNSRAYCERNGLEVVREYCDYAQTGRNVNRAQFQLMMEDARRGLFDYVVIYKVTRIMRNRDEMALARIMLRKAGVEILYAGEEIASGSSGVLQLGMLEVLAEYESAIDSERIRDGIQKNAERCMANGHTLYGWDIVNGRYVVNDGEARVLRKMKNMLFAGSSVADIVRAVSDERSRTGKRFNQDTVTKLLKRVQNGGTYRYAGIEVEGGMPGLWPQSEQDMVLSILEQRHRPRRRIDSRAEFPLSGNLWCSKCGRTMVGSSGTSENGATYSYYKCPKCRRALRRELLEDAVVDLTLEALGQEDVRERILSCMMEFQESRSDEKPQSYYLKQEMRRIDAAIERVWKAIEDGIAPPGGRERTEELRKRRYKLEADLRIAKHQESLKPSREVIEEWLDTMAAQLDPKRIIGTFVRFAKLEGNMISLYFAFDHWGNDFTPIKKDEPSAEANSSSNSRLVELSITKKNSSAARYGANECTIQVSGRWFAIVGLVGKNL